MKSTFLSDQRQGRAGPAALALTLAIAVAAVVIAAALGAFTPSDVPRSAENHGRSGSGGLGPTAASVATFLHAWVDPDGRVVRRDQGGDTVSEGQAYGLLLAVAADDRTSFDRLWTWTQVHLQQPDGSLAWRWQNGRVVDPHPATDADLDVVHALLLAHDRWHRPNLVRAAKTIAGATLRESTIPVREGRLLASGPWAVGTNSMPTLINPSYVVAGEADSLATSTGQSGWHEVAKATAALDRSLVAEDRLPPDWVQLPAGSTSVGAARPAPAPASSERVEYGLDAPRLLIRLATSCNADDRRLAARAPSAATDLDAPAVRSLDGKPTVSWQHPITDVAAAAVLAARGDRSATLVALQHAAHEQDSSRTYYGAAWVGLGTSELAARELDSCAGATS